MKIVFDFSNLGLSFVNISDLLDVLIISCLIYKIILWIKETRAWALFKGVMVLLVVFSIASICNFSTVYWLISNAFNVGLLALIVLFQPEIRKALEQLGKGNFLDAFIKQKNKPVHCSDG